MVEIVSFATIAIHHDEETENMIDIYFSRRIKKIKWLSVIAGLSLIMGFLGSAAAEDNVRGLDPSIEATYMPELGGVLNMTSHNQYGQKRDLSECIVLRQSTMENGNITVPEGGLYYASDTSVDARPLMRDPLLILGEHGYLLRTQNQKVVKENVRVKKGEKVLVDPSGWRLWFEFSTDHYRIPYGEFALISPAGKWPHRWALSTSFPKSKTSRDLKLEEGLMPQQKEFFMNDSYLYGATKLVAKEITFDEALFSRVEYPAISEAIFSFDRPFTTRVRQESYRLYKDKRIYAFRKETGILVEVRNWNGGKVLASKLLTPATQQEYKAANQDDMCMTLLDLDMHIELIVEPTWSKFSDYAPWVNEVPYGWEEGFVTFAIYDDLIKIEDGKPWPRDERYTVRLEPNLETGYLQRLVLENKEKFVLNKDNDSYAGPIKMSEIFDRSYFNVVAGDIDPKENIVKDLYVRDSFYQRTDNLILWKSGRQNIDFFIGKSPLVVSVMEDTFLQRLADPTYGVPVVPSKFTSYPKVIPNAKWFAPDPTCAFVPKLKGFARKYVRNREGYRLVASEILVIRASYIDYREGKIIIPPAGLYYSTRDSRNIRPGESFYLFGKKAYLERFKSYLVVRKNFRIDRWKEFPMGDENLLFWQDVPLGDGSKAMRYVNDRMLWGRTVPELRITKYSGNNWGANILLVPGLYSYDDVERESLPAGTHDMDYKYFMADVFGEGATYVIPKFVTHDFVEIAEMGTPGMNEFTITYKAPKKLQMAVGDTKKVGKYTLKLESIDPAALTVTAALYDASGQKITEKVYGPIDDELMKTLPQYGPSQNKIQMIHEDVQVDLDVLTEFDISNKKMTLYAAVGCETFERDKPWPADPRFMVRPDVCGHCYQLNELIIDNKDPIVLDEKNPVFVGPDGYFKIVIDDFDGEAVNAWHIEDSEGKKTPNLAEYARKNLDVIVGVNGTAESFLRGSLLDRLSYREIWRLK